MEIKSQPLIPQDLAYSTRLLTGTGNFAWLFPIVAAHYFSLKTQKLLGLKILLTSP